MGLIFGVFGIIAILYILNLIYVDDVVVDKIGYSYNSSNATKLITKEEAINLATERYKKGNYRYKEEFCEISIIKRKLKLGLKINDNYEISSKEFFATLLIAAGIAWILTVAIFGFIRIGYEGKALQKQNEYEILLKQVERIQEYSESEYILNGDIGSLQDTYNDVKEYNNWVIINRYWSNNNFMWWFYNPYANELELIEIDD